MSLILKYDLGNPHRLPVGYTPLAYIESTGTLYIDTTCLGNSNTSIILDYIYTELVSSAGIIGTGRGSTTEPMNGFRFYYNGANKYYVSCNSKLNASTLPSSPLYYAGERYHTLMNGSSGVVTTNGISVTVGLHGAGTENTYSLMLFKAYSTCCKAKLYKCTIILNGLTIRDFIPSKNSSGVVGLFDCVSQTFFTNSGTGTFIAGPEVVVLPYEYQQVEYLEALPRSSYIDTGIKPSANLGTELGYCGIGLGSAENIFFGASNLSGYAGNPNYCMETNGSTLNIAFNTGYLSVSFTANSGQRYKLQLNINGDKQYKIDGVVKITFSANDNLPTNYNLFLFKRSVSGGGNDSYNVYTTRLEYCKMWNGTTLVRNMIPCYRRSDLKPGMYDTVNNVFYTNSGSGEFILGPVVEESSRLLEYNQCTGLTNYVSHLTAGGRTTVSSDNMGFDATFTSNDTYCYINTKELMEGCTYTISCDVSGLPNGNYWDFRLWNSNSYSFPLSNGHCVMTFIVNTSTMNASNSNKLSYILWDDGGGSTPDNSSVIHVRNVKIFAGTSDINYGFPTKLQSYQINSEYDPGYYMEPDGSLWIHIGHHNNPASYLFSNSNDFTKSFYTDVNRWWDFPKCNLVDKWEFMVKLKQTSSSAEVKYRWRLPANPMNCTYNDIHGKVTLYSGNGYTATSHSGGYFRGNTGTSNTTLTYLKYDNNTNSSNWFGFGSWTTYGGGYPGYNEVSPTTGYEDVFLRIDNISNLKSTHFEKSRIGYLEFPLLPKITNGSVSFWLKFDSVKGIVVLGEKNDDSYYLGASSGGTGSWYHNKCGSSITTYVDGVIKTTPTADTNWHHVVFTGVNLSLWPSIYLNNYPTGNWNIDGCYCDFRVYDNVLTADEVLKIYKGGL